MKNNAALRTALFFELTKIDFYKFEKELINYSALFDDAKKMRDIFVKNLFLLIDDYFAPIVIKEISRYQKKLNGKTAQKRYASFFLTEDLFWTKEALDIELKYKRLLGLIKNIVQKEILSYSIFLQKLKKDLIQICAEFNISNPAIKNIKLNLSDRHNFLGSAIELTFITGKKIIYKPKSANSDETFKKILEVLNFPRNYSITLPRILNRKDYHWCEYIKYNSCKTEKNLHILYKKFGVLLAILDALNYSDGHNENFIISKNCQYTPVDIETIFTNLSYFSMRASNYFDLEFTGMIMPKNNKAHYLPTLQKANQFLFYPYKPHILNDNSDRICFKYKQTIKNRINKNIPNNSQTTDVACFKRDISEGLLLGYQQIILAKRKIMDLIKNDNSLYRQIVRPTLYYTWLIYKYFHPNNKDPEIFLYQKAHLLDNQIADYEKHFIDCANIPVFYHKLNKRHLFGYKNKIVIKNYFEHNSLYWIKEKIHYLEEKNNQKKRIKELILSIKRM